MDVKSRARIPQKRVQVGAPVFQPAGAEEQRLYTEPTEPVTKTTEADIAKRVAEQDAVYAGDQKARFQRIQGMYGKPPGPMAIGGSPELNSVEDRKARLLKHMNEDEDPTQTFKEAQESGELEPAELEEVFEKARQAAEAEKSGISSGEAKPPGTFEESPEEAKAKFRVQLQQAIEKGDIDPHEIQETIKRLGR